MSCLCPGATPPSAGLSLRESAEVYEKQRAAKRKYEEVEVVTGEEDESNVLQVRLPVMGSLMLSE